jgi:O-antigen/teichoic acid export membrane protein
MFKNISFISISAVLGAALTFLANFVFISQLDLSDFGILASSLVTINLYASFVGFGIGLFWLNIYGIEGFKAARWLLPTLRLVFILACLAIALILLLYFFKANNVNKFILLLAPWLLALVLNDLAAAKLQLQKKFNLLSLWLLFPHLSRIIVATYVACIGGGLIDITNGFFFMAAVLILFALFQINQLLKKNKEIGHRIISIQAPSIIDVLQKSWPFAASGFLYYIFFQTNILILYWIIGPDAAGIYYAAFMISVAIYIIPSAIFQKYLLPLQHSWAHDNESKLLAVFRFSCGSMLLGGLCVAAIVMLASQASIFSIFGDEYFQTSKIIFILSIAIPFRFMSIGIGGLLSVKNLMTEKIKCMAFVAVINLILNFSLIPYFSYYGAAIATICSELILLALYLNAIQKKLFGSSTWMKWNISIKSLQDL